MEVARVVKERVESREFSSQFFSFSRFLDSRESKKLEKIDITSIIQYAPVDNKKKNPYCQLVRIV